MSALTASLVAPCTVRPASTARPQALRPARLAMSRSARSRVVVAAEPATQEKSAVERAIQEAKETCDSGSTNECAAAWDEVEELSASAADKKKSQKSSDPLEEYCDDNPEADECRVYED